MQQDVPDVAHAPPVPFADLPPSVVVTLLSMLSPREGPFHVEVATMVGVYLDRVGAGISAPWSEASARAAVEVTGATFRTDLPEEVHGRLPHVAQKVVQHVHALVSGDAACVPAHEGDAIRAFFRLPSVAGGPHPRATDDLGPVGFVCHYRHVRPRARVTSDLHAARGVAPLSEVAACDAPVVARLRLLSGEAVPLRRSADGRLVRPVLSPAGGETMGVAAFRAACASGHAWVDAPFQDPLPCSDFVVGPSSLAVPVPRHGPSHEAASNGAVAAALARMASLTVIDGVVHRETGLPVLRLRDHVSLVRDAQIQIRVSVDWLLPCGLRSTTSLRTHDRPFRPETLTPEPSVALLRGGLGDGPLLARLASEWMTGLPPATRRDVIWDPRLRHEVVDQAAFPPDPDLPFRVLVALGRAHGFPRSVSPFREAARALAGGTTDDGGMPRGLVRLYVPDHGVLSPDPLFEALVAAAREEMARRHDASSDDVAGFAP